MALTGPQRATAQRQLHPKQTLESQRVLSAPPDRLEQVARLAGYLRDTQIPAEATGNAQAELERNLHVLQISFDNRYFAYLRRSGSRKLVDCSRSRREVPRRRYEPSGKDVTKVGKDAYGTGEQAEADVKGLCKKSNAAAPPSTQGNAE